MDCTTAGLEPSNTNMSAYTQFGYTYPSPASQLLVSQSTGGSAGGGGCCEGGRTIMTDPVSGQPVCSCQYDRLALSSYPRLGSGLGASGGVYGATYPSSDQNPYPSIGVDSSAFYSPLGSSYSMKEGAAGDVSMYGTGLGASPAGYYPYDPTFAAYGYGAGYDLAARRKNATRESTATLKAWLNEHKKNPYPTKGEKIMLAIITKMTLTQVSTWFANARRRLKKENKMTWEPRNKTDDDDAKLSDDEDDEKEPGDKDDDEIKKDDIKDSDAAMAETKVEEGEGQTELKSCEGVAAKPVTAAITPTPTSTHPHNNPFTISKAEKMTSGMRVLQSDCAVSLPSNKPKIWSLADTAACKTPPPPGTVGVGGGVGGPGGAAGGGWLAGGTTFPLPPTIAPAQAQYSRFQPIMPGSNPVQYMAGYNEGVGTDTPPQTPPNAKAPSSSSGGGAGGAGGVGSMMGGGSFMGGASSNYVSSGMGGLSSCSRGPAGPLGSGGGGPGAGGDGSLHHRYSGGAPPMQGGSGGGGGNPTGNNINAAHNSNTAFTPIYKNPQQQGQQASQQVPQMSTQQQMGGQQAQQVAAVPNTAGPYVS